MAEFAGPGTPLTEQGITKAAANLGVGAAELWAVMSVETEAIAEVSESGICVRHDDGDMIETSDHRALAA